MSERAPQTNRTSERQPEASSEPQRRHVRTNGASKLLVAQAPMRFGLWRGIQAKLSVSQPGDVDEQEAERVAAQVVQAPAAGTQRSAVGADSDLTASRSKRLATQRSGTAPAVPTSAPASVGRALQSPAQPLAPAVRSYMEPRFGTDFSGVRVHTGAEAAQSAHDVSAYAYTVGNQIAFAPGLYQPETQAGRRLLAHELAHVVQQSAGLPVVQRYESPEHQDIGDRYFYELVNFLATPEGKAYAKTYKLNPAAVAGIGSDPFAAGEQTLKVGTLDLTPGDVIALVGDFYSSPQALMSADPKEIEELLAAIKRERGGELGGGRANAEYEAITTKYRKSGELPAGRDRRTFIQLAENNRPHFAPTNRDAWKAQHLEAIKLARSSAGKPEQFQQALLIDSGGGHFLTDAFAAGHLFDVAKIEDAISRYLLANPARPANPEVAGYYALSDILGATGKTVLKNVHDRLNAEGLDVSNNQGMKWRTFGDDHLKASSETQRIAALAVYMSRYQVTIARDKSTPDPDPSEILNLLPSDASIAAATQQAIAYIPAAVASITNLLYTQRRTVNVGLGAKLPPVIGPLVGTFVQSNLATIASPGRERQLLDLQEQARNTGIPAIAPSLTVLEWK